MTLAPDDAFVVTCLARAAERVHPEPGDRSFLEKRLATAVAASLADEHFRPDSVVRDKKLAGAIFPGWDPQPGTIDIAVVTPENEPRIVFELKVDDVEWTLWDIYKMVSATQLPTVEAAYVVVAGSPRLWTSERDCVELFELDSPHDGNSRSAEWHSRFLFSRYKKAWADLLQGGTGRLQSVPAMISITAIGSWPLPAYPGYEIRALRVEASAESGEVLRFSEDWPAPPDNPPQPTYEWEPKRISNENLDPADLPAPEASQDEYHHFALTYNGYEEMGSFRRCARIANESLDAWRRSGALPDDIDELRACLFFEQRRWHHFGSGFDDETFEYLKATVAKLSSRIVGAS